MKTRKLLALVLALAMIATVFVVPSAADVAPGAACEILGLLEGDGEGVTAEYLAKGTTRAQGLLITLRARGLEDEAKAFTGTDNFADAADVNIAFWGPILAYAYANPDLGWIGDGDGNFRPADLMTGAELAKVMLAVLGYEQGVDFEWADIATFAASKGVTVVEGTATNDDLAASLVEALALETTEGTKLIDAMIADGIVTEEEALEAEVKDDEPVADAVTVAVTGVKTIKVTFAEAQDADTSVFVLKKGAVGQALKTPSWDAAKKVATIEKAIAFTKGDYTITANGVAVDFTVEANETATELVASASTVYAKAGAQDIKVNLLNQYGEKMVFGVGNLVYGASLGTLAEKDNNTLTLTLPATLPKAGSTSTIFAYYTPTGFSINTTITVLEDQVLTSIVFNGPVVLTEANAKINGGRLTEGTTGNTIVYKAYDQYGNTLSLAASTDYSLVISGATVSAVDATKMTLAGLTKGTLSIRGIALTTGNISELYTETVYAVPALASFDITVPEVIYQNVEATFTIAAVDQYGKPIDVDDPSGWTVNPLSTTILPAEFPVTASAKNTIKVTPADKGNADVYFSTGSLTVTKSITVLAAKKIDSIVSIPLTTEALLNGVMVKLDLTKVKLNDQYGNEYKGGTTGWNWELRRLADASVHGNAATGTDGTAIASIVRATATSFEITANTEKVGVDQLQLIIYTGATATDDYVEYTHDFSLGVVKKADIVAYELSMKDEIYAGATSATMTNSHDLAITVIGKTANGTTVTLVSDGTTALPSDTIAQYTTTNNKVQIDTAASKLKVLTAQGGTADGTATIKAWNYAGEVVAEKVVSLRRAAPAVTTLTMKYDKDADKVKLEAKDQYGIAIAAPAGSFFSSDTTKLTVNVTTGDVTRTATTAQTATIRFVSSDGVWAREVSVTQ
jgi:hypothetical protein